MSCNVAPIPSSRLPNSHHQFQQKPSVPCTVGLRPPASLLASYAQFYVSPIDSFLAGSSLPLVSVDRPRTSHLTTSASTRLHLAIVTALEAFPSPKSLEEAYDLARATSLPMGVVSPDEVYSSFVVYCPAKEEEVLR